jgi:DNA polymerase elongation subunit (family B)
MDIDEIKFKLKSGEYVLRKGALLTKEQNTEYERLIKESEYYDMLQGVRKILLNSSYGALLNAFMRFGDPRLGASTTYSGRQVTTHMLNCVSQLLTGILDYPKLKKEVLSTTKKKRTGEIVIETENEYTIETCNNLGVIYSDTDSCYFTMEGLAETSDEAIELANWVAKEINSSFQEFMQHGFNCQPGFDNLIEAERELVCRTGLLQAKKKYMMAMVDKDGKRIKPGDDELKTMGSDIKLSSTPEMIREMLREVVMMILNEKPKKEIDTYIINFRKGLQHDDHTLDSFDPLDFASVISVKGMEEYQPQWEMYEKTGQTRVTMPANVRSSINYNWSLQLLDIVDDPEIRSGDKIKILWLKTNQYGFESMAFPTDVEELPEWFKLNFEVDMTLMEEKLVDKKLENIFDALDWSVPTFQSQLVGSLLDIEDVGSLKKKKKPKGDKNNMVDQEEKRSVNAVSLLDF